MTSAHHSPDEPIRVAIDIAKVKHHVLVEVPGKKRRHRLQILNDRDGHNRLVEYLEALPGTKLVAFEATGDYHRPLAQRLLTAGFELRLISSVALARTREALHNGWDKNDPKDAQVILHMLEIGAVQFFHDPLVTGTAYERPRSSPAPSPLIQPQVEDEPPEAPSPPVEQP